MQTQLAKQEAELALAKQQVSQDLIDQEQKQSELSATELLIQKKDQLNAELVALQEQKTAEQAILDTALAQQLLAEQLFTSAL